MTGSPAESPRQCAICGSPLTHLDAVPPTPFLEAGELLAREVWKDDGLLCPRCLESRALLTIMYDPDFA